MLEERLPVIQHPLHPQLVAHRGLVLPPHGLDLEKSRPIGSVKNNLLTSCASTSLGCHGDKTAKLLLEWKKYAENNILLIE